MADEFGRSSPQIESPLFSFFFPREILLNALYFNSLEHLYMADRIASPH